MPNPATAIRILVTGGTFDKHYDAIKGELTFTDSHLPAILKQARLTIPYEIQLLPLIDSLNMDDAYRTQVLSACQNAPEAAIIVIHGTDTMAQTARVVGAAKLAKTIVFTGAMVPYSVQGSDALFNLGFAVSAAITQPNETYIAMNGRVFLHDDVAKNKVEGVFEGGLT